MEANSHVTQLIYDLELSLLKPEIRKSPDQLKKLISNEFIEHGSSGFIYNKSDLLKSLPKEKTEHYLITDFSARELSSNLMLATYKITVNFKRSLRASIWQLNGSDWQMIFHQGTPIPA